MNTCTDRAPEADETCDCGRPAVIVYIVTDDRGTREVPYCGISDGGMA